MLSRLHRPLRVYATAVIRQSLHRPTAVAVSSFRVLSATSTRSFADSAKIGGESADMTAGNIHEDDHEGTAIHEDNHEDAVEEEGEEEDHGLDASEVSHQVRHDHAHTTAGDGGGCSSLLFAHPPLLHLLLCSAHSLAVTVPLCSASPARSLTVRGRSPYPALPRHLCSAHVLATLLLLVWLCVATFDDATAEGQVEKVAEELRAFQELFDQDSEFQMDITSPLIRGDQFVPILEELWPELGIETDTAKDLITQLVTSSTANRLKRILEDYERLAKYSQKQVKARVTSAQALSSSQVERLREVLQKQINPDQTLELEQEVDESLLGGLKVDLKDRSIDLTVSQRLGELDSQLRSQ